MHVLLVFAHWAAAGKMEVKTNPDNTSPTLIIGVSPDTEPSDAIRSAGAIFYFSSRKCAVRSAVSRYPVPAFGARSVSGSQLNVPAGRAVATAPN